MEDSLRKAVIFAITQVGLGTFKQTSMFSAGRKQIEKGRPLET